MEIAPNHAASPPTAAAGVPSISPLDLSDPQELGLAPGAASELEDEAAREEGARVKIRVLLVDDEEMVRWGLGMRLEIEPDLEVVGEAEDGAGVLDAVAAHAPGVVLMDVRMPGADGIEVAAALRLAYPEVAVVMLTLQDDAETRERAEAAGASGFVGKHEPEGLLVEEIRRSARPTGDAP